MDRFETELARMMRDTQDTTPLTDEQRVRLRTGVRKRRRARSALVGGGSVAVVAALAAVLPSAFAASPAGRSDLVGAAGSSSPVASASPVSGASWMHDYMLRTFGSLLPSGYSTKAWSQEGGVPLHVAAPTLAVSGKWLAMLQTDLTTSEGRSTTALKVEAAGATPRCPSKVGAPYDTCTALSRAGGTVVVDQSFKNPENGTGAALWSVAWIGPAGQSVTFGEATSEPHQALTVQQAIALVTAPAWQEVWQALPAHCRFGAMVAPGATQAQLTAGEGLVCATSRGASLPVRH